MRAVWALAGPEGGPLAAPAGVYLPMPHVTSTEYRRKSYRRLFEKALGFGPEIYNLTTRTLDELRTQINWNARTGLVEEVGAGMTKKQARAYIKRLLGDS